VDDLPALDRGSYIDRPTGLVQRRSLFARLVGPMLVVVPRHLDNDMFTTLLRYGWIGSCGVGTEVVREQVWNSLSQRDSVVIGAHMGNWPLGNAYGGQRTATTQQ
jgi:hypothetical protein